VVVIEQPALALPRKRIRWGEQLVRLILFLAAAISVLTTVAIVLSLLMPAIDFFREIGPWQFLTGTTWAPLFEPGSFGVLPLAVGNVRQRPLTEIYRESPLFVAFRDPDQLKGRCGACEFRFVCGGSRSRAFGATGDPLEEESWCTYQPGSFGRRERIEELIGAGV